MTTTRTTTQRHEIEAWLGDDWTPDQVDRIVDEYQRWEADADLPDDPYERGGQTTAMLIAIAQHVDGTADLAELVSEHARAAASAEEARQALIAAVTAAIQLDGISEYTAAQRAGVSRMTIRSWLGK